MSHYGIAGRALRSPLNPGWVAGQPLRAAGGAMAGLMPAVSQIGDQLVDQNAGQVGKMAGEGVDALLRGAGPLVGANIDQALGKEMVAAAPAASSFFQQAGPALAKGLGRAAWAGGAGALGGAGDILSGESPAGTLANVQRASLLSMAHPGMGSPGSGGDVRGEDILPPTTMSPEMGIDALLRSTPGMMHPGIIGAFPDASMAAYPGQAVPTPSMAGGTGGRHVYGAQDAAELARGNSVVKAGDFTVKAGTLIPATADEDQSPNDADDRAAMAGAMNGIAPRPVPASPMPPSPGQPGFMPPVTGPVQVPAGPMANSTLGGARPGLVPSNEFEWRKAVLFPGGRRPSQPHAVYPEFGGR